MNNKFRPITFSTPSAEFRNNAGIPEHHRSPDVEYQVYEGFAFVELGTNYERARMDMALVTIVCCDTGMVDAAGREIYECPDGRQFVVNHEEDYGEIIVPLMAREQTLFEEED